MKSSALKTNDVVVLVTFDGVKVAPTKIEESENYWNLVGCKGRILSVSPPNNISSDRLLVQFEVDLDILGLPNHNEIENSLWIKISDVEAVID